MQDGTPLPLSVVTDYSVAMYFGGTLAAHRPDARVVEYILETVTGAETQAQAMANWLLFGAGPGPIINLTTDHLSQPNRGVPWSEALDIAVTELIWDDVQAGLDPLNAIPTVIRLNGSALQYRGVNAQQWSDVLTFDVAPDKSLAQMLDDTQLVGYGGKLFGAVYHGTRSGLALSTQLRLDAHADYAKALELNFVAYEGGSHVSYPIDGSFAMYDAFNTGTAGARVFTRWLEIMAEKGLDEYAHFMSHNRTNGNDWWGVKAYVGQDVATVPEAITLYRAIAAYDPTIALGFTGPLRAVTEIKTSPTGGLMVDMPVAWAGNAEWQVLEDGAAREDVGSNAQLRLDAPLPFAPNTNYQFTFDVDLSGTETTEIRFVARARGQGVTELKRWQGEVSDGEKVSFDLNGLTGAQSRVAVIVQRVGRDRSGQLTLRNADLTALRQ